MTVKWTTARKEFLIRTINIKAHQKYGTTRIRMLKGMGRKTIAQLEQLYRRITAKEHECFLCGKGFNELEHVNGHMVFCSELCRQSESDIRASGQFDSLYC